MPGTTHPQPAKPAAFAASAPLGLPGAQASPTLRRRIQKPGQSAPPWPSDAPSPACDGLLSVFRASGRYPHLWLGIVMASTPQPSHRKCSAHASCSQHPGNRAPEPSSLEHADIRSWDAVLLSQPSTLNHVSSIVPPLLCGVSTLSHLLSPLLGLWAQAPAPPCARDQPARSPNRVLLCTVLALV